MKISIDGLLGSAQRMNRQQLEGENQKKKEVRLDSVSISSKINSRLDSIESELRDIQTSLTKNQIIRDGIDQLFADQKQGGSQRERILSDVTFNGAPALKDFIGGISSPEGFGDKLREINEAITFDTGKLKRLEVELDNITASKLTGQDKADSLMSSINGALSKNASMNPASLSQLNPDAVIKLIK